MVIILLNTNFPSELIKTIRQWWPVIKSNFAEIQTSFNGHINGTADKHSASTITNDSTEPGENVKEVIENSRAELNSHYSGTLNKHSASMIVNDSTEIGSNIKDVIENNRSELNTHYSGEANRHTASSITNNSTEEGGTVEVALNNNKTRFDNHVAGTFNKHKSEDISYTGSFVGKDNVKAALDQAKYEIDTIIINSSKDPEVAVARTSNVKGKTFTTLDDRLEESEQDAANLINNLTNYETTLGSQAKADAALSESKSYTDGKTEELQTALQNTNTNVSLINNTVNTHLSDYTMQIPWAGTSTNSGNSYSLANPVISILLTGMAVSFKCNADATGAVTLNWAGTGDKSVLKANGLSVSNWKVGGVYTVRFDGINFRLQGEGGEYGTATTSDVRRGTTIGTENGIETGTATVINILPGNAMIYKHTGTGRYLGGTTYYYDYIKVNEYIMHEPGTYRTEFALKVNNSTYPSYGRIYVNGTPRGTVRTCTSTQSWVTYQEDITVMAGDKIQLYIKNSSVEGISASLLELDIGIESSSILTLNM